MPENVAERYRRVTIWSMSAMYGNTAHHGSGSVPTSIHAANSQAVPSQPMKLIAYSRFGPILVIAQPNTGISGSETAAHPGSSDANAAVWFQSCTTKNTNVWPNTSIVTCTRR